MDEIPDLYSLSLDDGPTAQEKAKAYATALSRQKELGDMFTLLGGAFAPMGQKALHDYDQGQQILAKAGELRNQRNVEAKRNAALEQYHNALADNQAQLAEIRQQLADRHRIFKAGNGETVDYDPNTSETTTVRGAPPPRPVLGRALKAAGGAGGPPGLPNGISQEGLDLMVEQGHATGHAPSFGAGPAGQALRGAYWKRMGELHPKADLASNAGDYGANTSSLKHFQTSADTIEAFEKTFTKNAKPLEDAIAELQNTNHPGLNKPLNWLRQQSGDPRVAKFNAALQTFRSEAAKINSGQTGAGGTPISVLEEMEHVLPPDASPAQLMSTIALLKQDAANRKQAIAEQRAEIRERISKKPTTAPVPAAAPQRITKNGKTYEKRADGWHEVTDDVLPKAL